LRSAPISELDIVEGELPSRGKIASLDSRIWRSWQAFQPYAALDGKGEVFVTPSQSPDKRFFASSSGEVTNTPFLVIRTAQPQAITGSLYLPNSDYTSMVAVSQGAVIKENSGDPHAESLVHGVLALNTESELVRQRSSIATSIANINPLSWIGQSIPFMSTPIRSGPSPRQLKMKKNWKTSSRRMAIAYPSRPILKSKTA